MSRHRVAALAKGITIVCLLRLVTKHLVNAEPVNIKLKEYLAPILHELRRYQNFHHQLVIF